MRRKKGGGEKRVREEKRDIPQISQVERILGCLQIQKPRQLQRAQPLPSAPKVTEPAEKHVMMTQAVIRKTWQ